MTYQALMFDIDGTLTNSQPAYFRVMKQVLAEYGHTLTIAEAQTTFPMAAEQAMAELGIPADQFDQFQARYEAVMAEHYQDIFLFPGIMEMLDQVPDDVQLGIVTSQRRNELESGMAQYHLLDLMAVTVSADDTPKRKPDPLPLLTALDKINVAPKDALFVGDSLSDEQTAAAAGVDFGLAVWGMNPNANHQQVAHRLENPAAVVGLFK